MSHTDRVQLGDHTTMLRGPEAGKYPSANPLLVEGSESSLVIDSALGVQIPDVDLVLLSHFHEDHTCGLGARPDLPVQIHDRDVEAVRTVEGFHAASGYADESYHQSLVELYDHRGVEQVTGFGDQSSWDLGGVRVTAVPLPGHTFGHCGYFIEPDLVFFTADVDLSSFGPFYGDIEASLSQTRTSLQACAEVDARIYSTSHHKGFVDGREEFLRQLTAYAAVLDRRDESILALLDRPRAIEELVGEGVVYRPGRIPPYALESEQRMVARHLDELVVAGTVVHEEDRYRRA